MTRRTFFAPPGNALAGMDILHDEVAKKRGLPCPGFSYRIKVLPAGRLPNPERLIADYPVANVRDVFFFHKSQSKSPLQSKTPSLACPFKSGCDNRHPLWCCEPSG